MKRFLVSAFLASVLASAFGIAPAAAQIKGRFSYDALIDCEKPRLRNFPIHVEGTASMSADRSASLHQRSLVGGYSRIDAKLGQKLKDHRGHETELRVTGRSSLRATKEYTNNVAYADLRFIGQACKLDIKMKLKPGKTFHTLNTPLGEAHCSKIRIVKTECSVVQ